MRRVHWRDTGPEIALRRALWARGLRFRVQRVQMPGKPDIVLPRYRTVLFVDGDLWHGNQWRLRNLASLEDQFAHSQHSAYWLSKIRQNMSRDCVSTASLLADGWRVLRLWESSILRDLEGSTQLAIETARSDASPDAYGVVPAKTCAEFFAGIGLVRMALERHGWTVEYANDIDEQKYAMYRSQFRDAHAHFDLRDVHLVDPARVPTVTLATASFPCNDLSLAGSRQGLGGKQSSAFWGFVRLLTELGRCRPPLVLLENVPGFLTSHEGRDFREALISLNRLGYAVDAFLLDAARFVPQSRQRLFVVGVHDPRGRAWGLRSIPQEWYDELRPKPLRDFVAMHPEIDWHIRSLPPPPGRTLLLKDVIEDLPHTAAEWWSPARVDYLLRQMSTKHRSVAEAMISGGDWSYGTVFRRVRHGKSMAELRTDGVAGCLRTPRGGSGRQILIKAGKGQFLARLLTPRECARLMGADEYRICVPMNQALFGFGDAVCVPVIEWIAQYYLNPLVNELIRDVPLFPPAQPRTAWTR